MKIFITGATGGIGLALAKHYLEGGHQVGVCGRDLSKLPAGFKGQAYTVDVTDRDKLKRAVHDFAQGKLNMIIANAGMGLSKTLGQIDFALARTIIDINVTGVLNTFEAAMDIFTVQGEGHLVALASLAGFIGLPANGPYCASKAALLKLCEAWAVELAAHNIHVSAIAPGYVDTPMTKANKYPMPFLMSAEEAAKKIAYALEKKRPLYIFPWPMGLLVTIAEKMPRRWYRFLMGLLVLVLRGKLKA